MAFSGVNYIDTYHRSGLYPVALPYTIGTEGAGEVVRVGDAVASAGTFKPGDRVAFIAAGSCAEYAAVPAAKAVHVPAGVDLRVAAAALLQGLTAHYLTVSTFPVQRGHTVFVHAGAGGTGGLVVQMAKWRGARVITTTSTAEKAAQAKRLGADEVINYKEKDFHAEVMRLTNNAGVEVVYDSVGKDTWERSLKCLKPLGYLVLFGNSSGPVPPVDPLMLSKQGSVFLTRPSLFHYIATPAALAQRAADVFDLVAKGQLNVRVDREFALAQTADAQLALESGATAGKIVIRI